MSSFQNPSVDLKGWAYFIRLLNKIKMSDELWIFEWWVNK